MQPAFDLDSQVSHLEREWHRAFEASIRARAEYHALAANPGAELQGIDEARERYEQTEALKHRLLDEMDLLAHRIAQHA